ncbi:MAG: phage holin family protein [Microbacteriaceae bacterium]|nr:phage holin family protein [Microbacteriaceae bacterium]
MEKEEKKPNVFKLIIGLPGQISRLIRAEISNVKNEIAKRVKSLAIGIVFLVIALVFLTWAVALLLAAAVAGLATVLPVWLSALIIAAVALLFTGLFALIGIKKLKGGKPVPEEALSRAKSDVEELKKVKEVTDQYKTQPGKKGAKPGKKEVWK